VGGKGGEMTQTLYAHMNKRNKKNKKKKLTVLSRADQLHYIIMETRRP
jgi:hypothetical protein